MNLYDKIFHETDKLGKDFVITQQVRENDVRTCSNKKYRGISDISS